MYFTQRLGYFLFGASLSMIFVMMLFGHRITSCAYFPNQRVLNDIKRKEIRFQTDEYISHLKPYHETVFIQSKLLNHGKIDFTESQVQKKPFPIYEIHYREVDSKKEVIFQIENQSKTAVVKSIEIK